MIAEAAVLTWLAVVAGLLAGASPVAVVGVAIGLALLSVRLELRAIRRYAVIVGCSLAILNPVIARYGVTPIAAIGPVDVTIEEVRAGIALGVRLAAVMLAVCLLAIPTPYALVLAIARRSHRTALLAAMMLRAGPVALRDAGQAREDLIAAGVSLDRGAPITRRIRGAALLMGGLVACSVERAFATAAALDSRGYGTGRPTTDPLCDPRLRPAASGGDVQPGATLPLLVCAALVLVAAIASRIGPGAGLIDARWTLGPFDLVGAMAGLGLGVMPTRRNHPRHSGCRGVATPHPAARACVVCTLPMGASVSLDSVRASYPGSTTLAVEVDRLVVDGGSFQLLVGPSGAGKSTLLEVIGGRMPQLTGGALTGRVAVDGAPVGGGYRSASRGATVGSVFQDPDRQTIVGIVAEEVALGPRMAGIDVDSIERRTMRMLDRLGCLPLALRSVHTLSGGELQRVMLAAALALEPRVLLLDEPTSQLDASAAAAFWEAVDEIRRERGCTVVACVHRWRDPALAAGGIVVLSGGGVVDVATADPAQIASRERVARPEPWSLGHPNISVRGVTIQALGGDGAGRTVIRGLDADMPAGAVIAVQGDNGCGKTTLLRALRGLHPHRGIVVYAGSDRRDVTGIGYLSQRAAGFVPFTTAFECAAAICRRIGVHDAVVASALEHAGLDDRAIRHPMDLSTGERQRLAIVAAIAHRPGWWLLDEPTRGLDATGRSWLVGLIAAHARRGGVVVLATHDDEIVEAVATHRWLLDPERGVTIEPVVRSTVTGAGCRPVTEVHR